MMELVLATRNPHKLREFGNLLKPHEVLALPVETELPAESGKTFADNALLKARAAARATQRPSVADDSGIVVNALGGAPGVLSARYAGATATDRQNLEKLLRECERLSDRSAYYVCALALAWPDGHERLFEARCEGFLASEPRGSGNFGYDPAFVPADDRDGRTMAELSASEKDRISHRGRAARMLLDYLEREPAKESQ